MKCPIDENELQMTERQGVEIDYCPKCRGVWLDRGELDKIIDRIQVESAVRDVLPAQNQQQYSQHSKQSYYGKHGRRKGLLSELFNF